MKLNELKLCFATTSLLFVIVGGTLNPFDTEENEVLDTRDKYHPEVGEANSCPPATALGICKHHCIDDTDCDEQGRKCCPTACGGSYCTKAVTGKPYKEKPGSCPVKAVGGPWICSDTCAHDGDCRKKMKCCRNRCGALACTKPETVAPRIFISRKSRPKSTDSHEEEISDFKEYLSVSDIDSAVDKDNILFNEFVRERSGEYLNQLKRSVDERDVSSNSGSDYETRSSENDEESTKVQSDEASESGDKDFFASEESVSDSNTKHAGSIEVSREWSIEESSSTDDPGSEEVWDHRRNNNGGNEDASQDSEGSEKESSDSESSENESLDHIEESDVYGSDERVNEVIVKLSCHQVVKEEDEEGSSGSGSGDYADFSGSGANLLNYYSDDEDFFNYYY